MYSVKVIGNFTLHKHESLITFMALVFSPIVMILLWTTSECQYIHPTNNSEWDSIQPLLVLQPFHTQWQNSQKSHLAFWILEWNKIVIKQEIGPIGLFCYITRCFGINQSKFLILPHCAIWGEWCDGTSKEREHTYKEPFFMVMVFELGYYTNIRKYFVYLHCTLDVYI